MERSQSQRKQDKGKGTAERLNYRSHFLSPPYSASIHLPWPLEFRLDLLTFFGQWYEKAAKPGNMLAQMSTVPYTSWRRKWQPTPVFLPGESHGRRSLGGCKESDTTERLHFHFPYTSTFVIKRTGLGEFKEDERYLEQIWTHLEARSQTPLSEMCATELFVWPLSFGRGLLHSVIIADQYKQGNENFSEEWLTEMGYLSGEQKIKKDLRSVTWQKDLVYFMRS